MDNPSDEFYRFSWESQCDQDRMAFKEGIVGYHDDFHGMYEFMISGKCLVWNRYSPYSDKVQKIKFYKSDDMDNDALQKSTNAKACREYKDSLLALETEKPSFIVGDDNTIWFSVEIYNPNPNAVKDPYITLDWNEENMNVYHENTRLYIATQSSITYVGSFELDSDIFGVFDLFKDEISCNTEQNYYNVIFYDAFDVTIEDSYMITDPAGDSVSVEIDYTINRVDYTKPLYVYVVVFNGSDVVSLGCNLISDCEHSVEVDLVTDATEYDHYDIYVG